MKGRADFSSHSRTEHAEKAASDAGAGQGYEEGLPGLQRLGDGRFQVLHVSLRVNSELPDGADLPKLLQKHLASPIRAG
jgi:hypothetical protein